MDPEVQDWLDQQSTEFMVPDIQWFEVGELDLDEGESEAGYYSRLTAPGYMDCTEWSGPYESYEDAAVGLYEMFAE